MRLFLNFDINGNSMPLSYRSSILSFIKHTLKQTDEKHYNLFYGSINMKGFTFSAYIPSSKISNNNYELSDSKFSIQFSFVDPAMFIIFYNAFNSHRGKEYTLEDKTIILKDIRMVNEKIITSEKVKIKFLSPLVIRNHNRETNKDRYIAFNEDSFNNELNKSVALMSDRLSFQNIKDTSIELNAIKAKKTVVPFKEISMTCSFGTFTLQGDTTLLNYLYKTGIGSRRSEGFGMFDIIRDGVDNNGE